MKIKMKNYKYLLHQTLYVSQKVTFGFFFIFYSGFSVLAETKSVSLNKEILITHICQLSEV